ncbi:hypothetical protein PZA11_006075 [Diplocarpon coronariae]|nr:hypothetical protein JHW43_008628 [Diplocarpon mali]
MALLNPTFIFGVIVLAYLSSFVVFAVLRIVTGISIQRIGYFSLRRLAYTPKDGIKLEIRGLGVNLHRPTFAQPTWVSIVLTELAVTIDLQAPDGERSGLSGGQDEDRGMVEEAVGPACDLKPKRRPMSRKTSSGPHRSKSWERLTSLKDRIKRLHRNINWIRTVDVVATNSSVTVVDVGQIQIGSLTLAVDTRRKMVDRGRMFSHLKTPKREQRPAEWMITVRSVLFTPEGRESLEVLDHATLNIHGLLFKELDGLRDAAISLKLGRVHIPYDDIHTCINRYQSCRRPHVQETPDPEEAAVKDLMGELDRPGSREQKLVQTVSDSKEFISSILRGIKGVQFAVSFVGFSKRINSVQPQGSPIYLNTTMKEVGIDLHRIDQKSPAHRMYFSSKDVAHQALVAALAISIGVDDGRGKSDRLAYIPMATTTIRTTLPSKSMEFAEDNSADERNANILFANIVITSPSVDLDPKHLPLILALLNPKTRSRKKTRPKGHIVMSRLLPKANVKFSMHEPVLRIALPPVEKCAADDDFDLIISSISSVSLDIESSHSAVGELHYALGSTLRVQSLDLYYQTSSGAHFDLLQTESLELRAQLNANPEVHVVATGNLQTFSIHMIRPEISDGVRQIVRQLRLNVEPTKKAHTRTTRGANFVRALPPWLLHFQIQGSDFSAQVAGVDEDISDETRGVALQLHSWTADYKAQRIPVERVTTRRRAGSRSLPPDPEIFLSTPTSARKKQQQHPTDGRRLAVHIRGLEAFIVESTEKWESEPFVAMPRFEVALSTSSDPQGPVFHVNSHVKQLLVHYSLYRHYAVGVATSVLRKAFVRTKADRDEEQARAAATTTCDAELLSPIRSPVDFYTIDAPDYPFTAGELITVDFRATLVQVKAQMPSDPAVMLQIYGMETGRNRWSPPFLHSKLARLYAEAPRMKRVWARLASIKGLRVDLRESRRRRTSGQMEDEKLIDVNSEAIRLAVPHQLVLHKVSDNIINTLKAVQQLHHRFVTGTNEYILDKRPEGPKHLPKISIRSRALLFELEDGAFEWKLGAIYRTGLVEQAQRLAREAAFRVKAKKIEEEEMRKDSSRFRNRSAHPQSRGTHRDAPTKKRSKSEDNTARGHRSRSHRGRHMRYDPEGTCGVTSSAKISIGEAQERLRRHDSQSWKKRIDRVYEMSKSGMKEVRGVFWGPDQLPDDMEDFENILEAPQRPALMATLISDLHISIDKPSFPMHELPEFIHRVGKGMPYDMQYSLLVPMHVQIDMGEARITLRDYPLPLLHVPAIKPGQHPRTPAWSLKSNFVIAEEFRGRESTRHVKVDIIPPKNRQPGTPNMGGFAIDVRRTVSPVKSYSDIKVDISTGFPTRITWGASFQPAIQDMMMVVETFTKPQVDPSDRTGFWDKIRLSFHSRVTVAWRGDGNVHLMLKGTRDPYSITGDGAGFLMCWRNDVRWNICREEDPRKFMTVDSGEFILAIPDFNHQARIISNHDRDSDSVISMDSFRHGAAFKKVVMKLSGKVQWQTGLMFERNLRQDGKRSFDFEPHYNVVLKEPQFAKAPGYDAFQGFRSNHIHMSIAVKAPVDREWSVSNLEKSNSYNTVHLTPRFFSHFFAWWSMFNGTMSLPIRQGTLWPGIEKSSKKFGRHLATIKYNLLLAPLFISHIYKHKDAEDYAEDVVSATGLKMRLDSFMLDMHQRREEFPTHDKSRKTKGTTTGMKMHRAQLDLLSADIRAITASIAGTTPEDLHKASVLVSQAETPATDLSHFEIPDNDFSWIDMDDFVELDWILPSEANPETKIMPLAYTPCFTYFRQTDHGDTISGDPDRTSPFGNEQTHFCIMSKNDDPRRVQCQLIQSRLDQLENQMESHNQAVEYAGLECVRDSENASLRADFEQLSKHGTFLRDKRLFLESMMHRMAMRIHTDRKRAVPDGDADVDSDGETTSPKNYNATAEGMDTNPGAEFTSDFNNRFVIHNMQLKWNNLLRNIILRYIHQVGQRRGFVYYLSRRAVKFILDIVNEQNKAKAPKQNPTPESSGSRRGSAAASASWEPGYQDVEDRINELLADGRDFVNADEPKSRNPVHESGGRSCSENAKSSSGREFTPQNSYHVRLIAPQIQLQSEKNPKAVVLVTAKGMELKVIEVMDKDRIFDNVSGLVQRRFTVEMDSTQFFVTHQKWFSSQLLSMYSGNHYGVPAGSVWPPWVPLEVMFDFKVDPFGFKRIVQKTSATLRYEKYNTLRLKYNDEISSEDAYAGSTNNVEDRMDHLYVEFPQIFAICNSAQYYAIYIIVVDLLMYSEPLEKTRNERLEKIMLASDFSDLRGAPEMVIRLQERIRQLEEIKNQFQINSKFLDKKGWEDRLALDRDLTSCEDELFFMMKAITSSQRKYDATQTSGLLRWIISSDQIVWHLIRDNNEPLLEFQLQHAEYDRVDNSDGSHMNNMSIGKIVGLNLLPDALYPEMFAPYQDHERRVFHEEEHMLSVKWNMLEAIAGIPVVDRFEVNLFPMTIQLEHEVGKRLFDYMFPGHDDSENQSPFMVKHMQPVEDEDDGGTRDEKRPNTSSGDFLNVDSGIRPGSLELRLRPTLHSESRPSTAVNRKPKASSLYPRENHEGSHFRLFQSSSKNSTSSRGLSAMALHKKASAESLQSSVASRPSIGRSSTVASNHDANSTYSSTNGDTKKRFGIHRNPGKKEKPSDDLTKMMTRASEYMTLAHVKITSVVLCLSYKGKGGRNIQDVHGFVFRLPEIEYRNKTWSNLDLALALKKDVIRALISHTGAIIQNKFKQHRPTIAQQHRLRELATSSMLLNPSSQDNLNDNSDASSSLFGTSPGTRSEQSRSPRRSFASSNAIAALDRTPSNSSSVVSMQSAGRQHQLPASMMMTPAHKADDPTDTGSERTGPKSTKSGHDTGFVASTLGRLRKKEQESSPGLGADQADEHEDGSKKKRGLKKILGGLASDH